MVTKNQYLEESVYILGNYNNLTQLIRPTRMKLKEVATEEGILLDIEQRVALKRALKKRKVEFNDDTPTHELVQMAISKKINFDRLLSDD